MVFVSWKEEHEQEVFLVARNVIVKSKQWKESSFQLLAILKERGRWTGVGYILIFPGASCTWPVAISESWGHQDTGPLPRLGQTPAKKVGQHVLLSLSLSSVFANSFFALPLSPASLPLHSSSSSLAPFHLLKIFLSLYYSPTNVKQPQSLSIHQQQDLLKQKVCLVPLQWFQPLSRVHIARLGESLMSSITSSTWHAEVITVLYNCMVCAHDGMAYKTHLKRASVMPSSFIALLS